MNDPADPYGVPADAPQEAYDGSQGPPPPPPPPDDAPIVPGPGYQPAQGFQPPPPVAPQPRFLGYDTAGNPVLGYPASQPGFGGGGWGKMLLVAAAAAVAGAAFARRSGG